MKRRDLLFLLSVAFVVRIIAAVFSEGFNHPDEHFQVLEPAYGILYGDWLRSWEWERGIRSWLLPYFFAGVMKVLSWFGIRSPDSVAMGIREVSGAFSLFSVWAAYELGERFGGRLAARIAGTFAALWWAMIYFGVHTLTEPLAMNFALVSHVVAFSAPDKRKPLVHALLAGALAGLAFAIRFQMAFFIVALGMWFLWGRHFRLVIGFAAGAFVVLVLQGVLDWATWGSFLHSPIEYFRFNVIEGGASELFGRAPWHRYFTALGHFFTPPLAVLIFLLSLLAFPAAWPLLLSMIVFWLGHQAIAHKEDRFLMPLIPFFGITAAVGFTKVAALMSQRRRRTVALAVIVLVAAAGIYKTIHFKWNWHGDLARLYQKLGERPDLRGLAVIGKPESYSGGYFYLNRKVPFLVFRDPQNFSFEIVPAQTNYLMLYSSSGEILSELKIRGVGCSPDGAANFVYRCE